MKDLLIVNFVVAMIFTLCYVYQFVYLLVALIRDTKKYPDGGDFFYRVSFLQGNWC